MNHCGNVTSQCHVETDGATRDQRDRLIIDRAKKEGSGSYSLRSFPMDTLLLLGRSVTLTSIFLETSKNRTSENLKFAPSVRIVEVVRILKDRTHSSSARPLNS